MNRNRRSILLVIGFFFALAASVLAMPSDLDLTFGNGGRVITAFTWPNQHGHTGAYDVALQPDGKIVIAGSLTAVGPSDGVIVVRYNPDGSLDTTFGFGGKVLASLQYQSRGYSLAIQPDGRIVVVGSIYSPALPNEPEYLAVRFETTGAYDTSFGTGGVLRIGIPGEALDVALQPDGKLVIVGSVTDGSFCLVRLNSGGSLDTSFDGDGKVFAPGFARKLALQQDARIIVAGSASDRSMIARFNPNGSLDETFDGDGVVITPVGILVDFFSAVAIQPDGRIVAAGAALDDEKGYYLSSVVRYSPTGALDSSFDGDGINKGFVGFNSAVVIQANGKIVTGGGFGWVCSLTRYNSNGSFDASFGNGGIRIDRFEYSSGFAALTVQPDGEIVAAGSSYATQYETAADILIARYLSASSKPFDFDNDGRADISVFRPSDRTWYLNQSSNGFSATQFGLSTDKITPADYDGDGRTDISVYRDGTWYWLNSSDNSFNARQFGIPSDIPVPADYYAGGGRSELAVYRGGTWWILNLFNNQISTLQFGLASDKPVVGDYDGDGRADQAVYRNGEWHVNRSTQGYWSFNWGFATDTPVPEDYDGDGETDPAVYRDGTWYLLQSLHGWGELRWGISSDVPVPADYDGDGKSDAAVYRDGIWYLNRSTGGVEIQQFGLVNDKPVPSAYVLE